MDLTVRHGRDFRVGHQPWWASDAGGYPCHDTRACVHSEYEHSVKPAFFLLLFNDLGCTWTETDDLFAKR